MSQQTTSTPRPSGCPGDGAPAGLDTVENAAATADLDQPWAELGLKSDEYASIREILGRRPTIGRAGDVLRHVERALLLQVEQGALRPLGREHHRRDAREAARRHRRERRRRRHRRRLGGHLQGRVAQPPELRRALPGRRDRRRWHRARHHVDGRPADRGHGLRCASATSTTPTPCACYPANRRGRRRLRQLPRPAQHRRRGGLRRLLPGQPARQRALRRRHAGRGHPPREGVRCRQPGDPLRRQDRRRRHRRGLGAGLRDLHRGRPDQAASGAGRRPVRREGAHRVLPRPLRRSRSSPASRTSAAPGCPVPPASSRPTATAE